MTKNECERVFALLSEYLDEELPSATCADLKRHLAGCPPCIRFVESLQRSIRLCGQLGHCHDLPPLDPEAMAGLRAAYEKMLARRHGP